MTVEGTCRTLHRQIAAQGGLFFSLFLQQLLLPLEELLAQHPPFRGSQQGEYLVICAACASCHFQLSSQAENVS